MVKSFIIIEKIVWVIAALAIVAVLAMVLIGAFANIDKAQLDRSSYIPCFYVSAAVVVLYKIVVMYYTSFYQTGIDEKTGMLASLDDEMKRCRASSQEESLPDAKFEANKDLCIPLNKKLRNAELKQFVTNIIRYNKKDNLDGDSFLQTAFGEWFSGKKDNIAKSYSMLPKDSLVSKDGVEVDLERLRKLIEKNQDNGDRVLINKFVVI